MKSPITESRAAEAKARWGETAAYREYEKKTAGQSADALRAAGDGLMELLAGFGRLKTRPAADPDVQSQVRALQDYVTAHFYTCTDEILAGLGRLYATDEALAQTIDRAGGAGSAAFAAEAIRRFCAG